MVRVEEVQGLVKAVGVATKHRQFVGCWVIWVQDKNVDGPELQLYGTYKQPSNVSGLSSRVRIEHRKLHPNRIRWGSMYRKKSWIVQYILLISRDHQAYTYRTSI